LPIKATFLKFYFSFISINKKTQNYFQLDSKSEEETLTSSLVVDVTSAAVCVDLQICDLQNHFLIKVQC